VAGAPDLRGLAPIFFAGVVAIGLTVWAAPPALLAGLYWLIAPRFGLTLSTGAVWGAALTTWSIVLISVVLWGLISEALASRKLDREHAEFTRLRNRFYARSEVCPENLASLRRRAAAADQPEH
jgi:hypothetical protein